METATPQPQPNAPVAPTTSMAAPPAESEKITKLEQEIFTVVKQSEELKRQLTDSLKANVLLKERAQAMEVEKLEKARLLQTIEKSRDELLIERTELQNSRVLLQSQKDLFEGESTRLLNEKRRLADELLASREEAANAKKELCLVQVQLDELGGEKRLIAYEKERWSREKDILLQGKQWCMHEISDRETKLNELRVQLTQVELRLQRERATITAEKEELSGRVEELEEAVAKRDTEIATLRERVQQMVEERATAMNELDAELRAKERLTDVYKQSLDSANAEVGSLKESEARLHTRLEEMDAELGAMHAEMERQAGAQLEEAGRRDEQIARLEDELAKANELLQVGAATGGGGAGGARLLHRSEEELAAMSPAAAAAANLLKSGYSLTSIYAEHCRVVSELERKSEECTRIERYVTELIEELDAKAPMFKEQSELYEKGQEEIETLRLQCELLAAERQKLMEARDALARELLFTNKELEKYQRDHHTLKLQVRRLLFVAARGESPNGSYSAEPASGTTTAGGAARDAEREEAEEYALFSNINELHQRNVELLSRIKQMEAEQEERLEAQRSEENEQLIHSLGATEAELTRLRENLSRQELVLHEVTAQRDNYKRLYEEAVAAVSASTDEAEGVQLAAKVARGRQSLEAAESELQHAKRRADFLQEKLDYFAEDKQRLERALNTRIDQLMEQISQLRTTNGKLESDLEFQKENQRLYQKQLADAESDSKKQAEGAQKAMAQHDSLHARYDHLSNQLIEQQSEVSRLRVASHSLGEQLAISRSNEQRTSTELEILRDSRYNTERVAVALQEVEVLLKRVDAEKETSLHSQLQSACLERDNLKALIENLNRQHMQIANGLKMQLNQITCERDKVQLDSKSLHDELALAESNLRTLREEFDRVTAASVEIPAADTSLESCKKEVQQLKNKLTYQEKQLAEAKAKCDELAVEVGRRDNELAELQKLSGSMETTMKEQSEFTILERLRLQARAEQLETDLATANSTCETLRNQVAALELSVAQRERAVEQAEMSIQEMRAEMQTAVEAAEQEKRATREQMEQLQQAVESMRSEVEKVTNQLSSLSAERDSLSESLATQTKLASDLEQQSNELRTSSQAEIESLRNSAELKETERLRLLDEITSLQQRDRQAAERTEQMYTEIQKLVEQVCLLEQMNSSGVAPASLDTSGSSLMAAVEVGGGPAMERLNTIIGYMREEKTRETELRMNAELEMQRQRARCQLAEERVGKTEAELAEAKQLAESNRLAAMEREQLVSQLGLFNQVKQNFADLRRQTEELRQRQAATDMRAREAETALLQANKEKAETQRRVDTLQKEAETQKKNVQILRQRNEQATALAAKYSPERYTAVVNELERLKQVSAAQGKEMEVLRTQLEGGQASSGEVAKLRQEVEEKNRLLVQTRTVGKNYRDKFNEATTKFADKEKEVVALQAELTQLQQRVTQLQSQAPPAGAPAAAGAPARVAGQARLAASALGAALPIVNQGPRQRAADAAEIEALRARITEMEKTKSDLAEKTRQLEVERDEAVEKCYRLDTIDSLLNQKERKIKELTEKLVGSEQERENYRQELETTRAEQIYSRREQELAKATAAAVLTAATDMPEAPAVAVTIDHIPPTPTVSSQPIPAAEETAIASTSTATSTQPPAPATTSRKRALSPSEPAEGEFQPSPAQERTEEGEFSSAKRSKSSPLPTVVVEEASTSPNPFLEDEAYTGMDEGAAATGEEALMEVVEPAAQQEQLEFSLSPSATTSQQHLAEGGASAIEEEPSMMDEGMATEEGQLSQPPQSEGMEEQMPDFVISPEDSAEGAGEQIGEEGVIAEEEEGEAEDFGDEDLGEEEGGEEAFDEEEEYDEDEGEEHGEYGIGEEEGEDEEGDYEHVQHQQGSHDDEEVIVLSDDDGAEPSASSAQQQEMPSPAVDQPEQAGTEEGGEPSAKEGEEGGREQ